MGKYNNKKCKTTLNGKEYSFDSLLERNHAIKLVARLNKGIITNLSFQPEFELLGGHTYFTNSTKSGKTKQAAIKYISDFKYTKDGRVIVEDVKGMTTSIYQLKKKIFLSKLEEFGIDEFREIYKADIVIYKSIKNP